MYNSVFLACVNKKPLQPPPNKGVLYSAQQRVQDASCPGDTKTEAHHVRAILTQLLQISLLFFHEAVHGEGLCEDLAWITSGITTATLA